jgi:hypothetical protein
MTKRELEKRLGLLEQLVLTAAAQSNVSRDQLSQLSAPLTPLPQEPAKPKAKPKPKPSRRKLVSTKLPSGVLPPRPNIIPAPTLEVVEGALEPLKKVLAGLKTTKKANNDTTPLLSYAEVVDRGGIKPSAGVKGDHIRQAWSTIYHVRLEDEDGNPDIQALKADLVDFKRWCHDEAFSRLLNLDPGLAVCWFFDVLDAASGALFEEDQ